jgi:hypothetical protein
MNREEHLTFINTSIVGIMRDVVSSANLLGDGMAFYSVHGYLLQSLFLQMTGAQEQKMKCICWELATNNLQYRYDRYYKGWSLSECSTLENKSKVYEDLMDAVQKMDSSYKPYPDNNAKKALRDGILNQVSAVFDGTNIAKLKKKEFDSFVATFGTFAESNFVPDNGHLLKKGNKDAPLAHISTDTKMFAVYHLLYTHRNGCAHNTPSYQLNLPHLYELKDESYQTYNNIFMFYATLILIDEVFRKVFAHYQELIKVV